MTIGKKISLAFTMLVALTIILGTVSILSIGRMNTITTSIVNDSLPGIYLTGRLSEIVKDQKIFMLMEFASDNAEEMARYDSSIANLEREFRTEWKTYEKTIYTNRERELAAGLVPAHDKFNQIWARIQPLLRARKPTEALSIWTAEALPAGLERAKALTDISNLNHTNGVESGVAASNAGAAASFWSWTILGCSIILGGVLAFFIVRSINGVLTQAITELAEGAEQVGSASGEVSGSSQSLAQGASEQAASLEETSASSAEMSSMTRKNAQNSQQAAEFMNTVSQRIADANTTLADMMTSMQEIGASSGKISKIIKVIDEIAFQTNILALNAAVEAARAGEAGMGFAVVADEVRNLAQRSAQAAKDTASLIEESILKSGEGSKKLGEVAGSIQGITEGAGKVKMLVDEVEASSKEQAQGIEQISKAVAQMDQVTQRTAANAEESASASEELSAQAQALMAVVGRLQTLVGADSAHSLKTTKMVPPARRSAARPPQSNRRLPSASPALGKPALAAVAARNPGEFPLDDSEFKEF